VLIKTKQFTDLLNKIKLGTSQSINQEGLELITFKDNTIISYDGNNLIVYPFKTDSGKEQLNGSIAAKQFISLINKIKAKEIILLQKENEIIVKTNTTKAVFNIVDRDDLPEIDKVINGFDTIPNNFNEAINFCLLSVETNIIGEDLTCIKFKDNYAFSSNSNSGSRFKLSSELSETYLIPYDSAKKLPNFNPTGVCNIDNWICFINEDEAYFYCRTMKEKFFLQLNKFFKVKGVELKLPKTLIGSLEKVGILENIEDDIKVVNITIKDNKITCKSQSKVGWIKDTKKIDYNDKALDFVTVPETLIKILDKTNQVIIGENRLLFKTDEFLHVVILRSN
jgi:hypothetical protein